MSLTNPEKVVTEQRLSEFYQQILPYLGGMPDVVGGGFAPIGTIIAYMGTSAPEDYLACNGAVYSIADYQQLANFFETQFGSKNYFGGNGTTTFAVPDLRGEFLRGTGTNSHSGQGNGENVGVHQNGTNSPMLYVDCNNEALAIANVKSSGNLSVTNADKYLTTGGIGKGLFFTRTGTWSGQTTDINSSVSRPTNTSILWCIKAVEKGEIYSTDERIVGTWIDGRPLYQKTVWVGSMPDKSSKFVSHNITNLDRVVTVAGSAYRTDDHNWFTLPYTRYLSNTSIEIVVTDTAIKIVDDYNWSSITDYGYVTIQYTKTTN